MIKPLDMAYHLPLPNSSRAYVCYPELKRGEQIIGAHLYEDRDKTRTEHDAEGLRRDIVKVNKHRPLCLKRRSSARFGY